MKTNKLFIHEYPPGSGKTHSMIQAIKESDARVVYCAPTLKLVYEIAKELDCFVITGETPPRGQTVSEYLFHNKDEVDGARVILTTHATLLRHANCFGERTLVIDELPLEVLQFKSIWTSMEDASMLRLIMSSKEQVQKRLIAHKQGSSELSDDKAEMLECVLSEQFAIEEQQGKEKYGFHYAYYTDPAKFESFDQIHLMAATVKDTMPYTYFTNICDYQAGISCDGEFNIRGNEMTNKVIIYPLIKFDNAERNFISKEVLEANFDDMVAVVQKNTDSEIITVTNKDKQKALKGREPLELIPTKAHGLNLWKDKCDAAVIYSANPNPYQIPFMQKCSQAMGYGKNYLTDAYVMQNMLDVVYQAVTRTAIRNHGDNRPCKFFVPDVRTAEWLVKKFPNAVIDDTQAVIVEDKSGGQIGNTNAKGKVGKGCPVIQALVDRYATKPKAKRLVVKFEKANGFKPDVNEPQHMLSLYRANSMSRVPKDYDFTI